MRERGVAIEVASINPPDRPREDLPAVEAAEAEATFYIKRSGKPMLAAKLIAITLLNPRAAWRGLRAAFGLGGWDLKARAFALFYLAEAMLVGNWMRRRKLTHLHVHFGGPVATVGMLTSQAWRVPWSLTLHGPDEFFDQNAFYLREKIELSSFVFCISDFCRSQVLRIAPSVDDSRLEVIRLGVDCALLQPSRRSASSVLAEVAFSAKPSVTLQSPIRIVCTGRMVAAKGHRILLEAVAQLIASGVEPTLTLIGDGPERPSLQAECQRLEIVENVRFLGALAHESTLAQVAQADIFVLASFAEGLPVALMEAMALGIPCISTPIAAIPELIHHRENGLLVPPANSEALFEAIARLVRDPEFRHRLGVDARLTVELEYNLATNLDLLAAAWERRLG